MPINRYEIRDEYSLADPELYRAADKDDPEALLEGVAMAGLVGFLRQLGDLAEFAAEIFHDLHEEVMVTAARGHTLMIRVQQLEADIPSLEKEFLSQTDHSPFFYNSGVDWHSNQQVDQNLVTQRDLPRFVMDSYEECRGPPRLFLLDKFDVAGSGACLKRYTDPSFFKAEASVTANADVLKEKKIRKAKKKGPQGKYGETPEFKRASSHAKLHQLLLEEPVENGVGKPTYRAKLKRRPNGYPFDTKSGKSYMEGLLKSPSPEHKMIHEIIVRSPLEMSTDDHNGSALELRSMSPDRESEGRRSNPPYADIEETVSNPSMNQISYDSSHIKTYGVPSHLNSLTDGAVPIYDEETDEKDITIDGESKLEDSLISYQSDEFASEIDNYVDAPSTMESEIDTDSELRVKKNFTVYTNKQPLASVKNKERCHSMSLDSQSTGDFSISDEGNHSYKKEMSSFSSSNSARTSAENPQSEKLSADGFSYTDSPEFVLVRTPEHFRTDKFSKDLLSNHAYPGKSSAADTRPNFEHPATGLGSTSLPYCNLRKGGLGGAKSDETFANLDDDEKKRDMILDSPCSPRVSHSKSLGEDSKISSTEEHILDAEIQYASTGADNIDHTSDHVDAISAYVMHEEVYDQKEELNQSENMASIMNMDNIISQNTIDIEETKENPTPSILDGEAAKLTDNFVTDHTDIAGNGDNGIPKVSEEENQSNYLYTEYPEVVSDSEHHFSNCSNVNQISADTSVFSGPEHSPILLEAGLDTQDTDLTPKELTTINGTSELGNPKPSEVVGLQVKGMENDATPDDLVALESSYYVLENLEDSSGTLYAAGKDGINPDGGIAGLQLAEISSSSLKLPAQVPVPVNQFDSITYQSETAGLPSSILAFSDSGSKEHVSSPAAPLKLVEEQIPCLQDLGPGVLENDTTCLSGVIREPEVVEEEKSGQMCLVEERETAALDFESVCSTEHDDDHPKPEVSYTDSIIYHDSEVEQKAGTVNGAKSQPPVQQSWLHKEEESVQQRIAVDQVSDVATLHIGCVSEESVSPETFALPQTTVNNELPDSCTRVNSESSSTLPASQLQMRDHDNYERFGDLASSFPPESYPSSESLLPGSTDASAKPNDPLGFIFSPGDLFSKTNQVNLDESHPLPPLPPLQWRIGKLQHASSTTKADKTELEELFPKEIFPYESAIENVKFVPEQVKQSPIQSPHMTFKEENLEHGFPSLETNSLHMTIGFPQKVENEQPQLFTLSKESEVSSPAEAVGVSEESETVKSPTRIVPKLVLKEENTELYLPTVEAESVNEVADPSPEVENEKPQLFTLAKESEVSPPAVEDGVSEESQTVKSPSQIVPKLVLEEENTELCLPTLEGESVNQVSDPSPEVENEQPQLFTLTEESEVSPPAVEDRVSEGSQTVKSPAQIVPKLVLEEENTELCFPTLEAESVDQVADPPPEVEKEQPQLFTLTKESEVSPPAVEDGVSEGSQTVKSSVQKVPKLVLEEENTELSFPTPEAESVDQVAYPPPEVEKEQQQLLVPAKESEVPSPAVADGVSIGSRTLKLPRTCNPIIGSVAALDKSRLRKVTEQARPQIGNQDERNAMLEQIRAKTFSLKPTSTSRPKVQGPNTNLKVAAILEKANAIRQAFAGSDEDEDSWSDS